MKRVLKLNIIFVLTFVMILCTTNIIKADTTNDFVPVVGQKYSMGGYDWYCAAYNSDTGVATMQSTGMQASAWPGYVVNGGYYMGSWAEVDISSVYGTNSNLYKFYNTDKWSKVCADKTKGLYLVSRGTASGGYYFIGLREAARKYALFGAYTGVAWTGTPLSPIYAYSVDGSDVNHGSYQYGAVVVAPCIDVYTRKLEIENNTITIRIDPPTDLSINVNNLNNYYTSTDYNLSNIITSVKYIGGFDDEDVTDYTVEVDNGTINGDTYTAPSNTCTAHFTITESANSLTKTVSIEITDRPFMITGSEIKMGTIIDENGQSTDAEWIVVNYDESSNTATLQSTGMDVGAWPGYVANDTTSDWSNKDISSVYGTDSNLYKFYNTEGFREVCTDNTKGLYLDSSLAAQSGDSNTRLKAAAAKSSLLGASSAKAWTGTPSGSNAYTINSAGELGTAEQSENLVLAPSIDVDTSKLRTDPRNSNRMLMKEIHSETETDIEVTGSAEANFIIGIPTAVVITNQNGNAIGNYNITVRGELAPTQKLIVQPQSTFELQRRNVSDTISVSTLNSDANGLPKTEFAANELSKDTDVIVTCLLKHEGTLGAGSYSGVLEYTISLSNL